MLGVHFRGGTNHANARNYSLRLFWTYTHACLKPGAFARSGQLEHSQQDEEQESNGNGIRFACCDERFRSGRPWSKRSDTNDRRWDEPIQRAQGGSQHRKPNGTGVTPGCGPATAEKIIAGRPYSSTADLSKAGVPAKTISGLSGMVTVGASGSASKSQSSMDNKLARPGASSGTAQAGGPGMVWVNPDTKVFHRYGSRWYGKTKTGQYMTEADALKAGYRESKQSGASK